MLQSEDALERIERLDDLLAGWRRGLAAERSRLSERVLDLFAENPFWTVRGVSSRLGVAFTTAQRGIERLRHPASSPAWEKAAATASTARRPS